MEVKFLLHTIAMLILLSVAWFLTTTLIPQPSPQELLWISIGIITLWGGAMVYEADQEYSNRHRRSK